MLTPGDSRGAGLEKEPRKLRIVAESVSLEPLGGIEVCTFQDSLALANHGHSITLFFGDDGVLRSEFERAAVQLVGPTKFQIDVYRPISTLRRIAAPARRARAAKPDILWLTRFEHFYWAYLVAKWSGCKVVCQLHHAPSATRLPVLHRGIAHFAAVSHFMRNEWIKKGIDPARISVIENALPPRLYPRGGSEERADARRKLGLMPDPRIVLYYGRIVPEKGVGTLLKAWAQLGLSPLDAQLVLVGSPSPLEDPDFADQLSQMDPAACRWFPLQENVVPFLHAADLVVFPTQLEEAFGRVILEGLATGRPVIAARSGAVSEVMSGFMSRFLVEPRSADDLADRIMENLNWRRDEPELEETCATWVEENFPYDRHLSQLEELLGAYAKGS
jgi:glycosyltransferase involved in cell wall biosynthesis